MQTPRKRKKNIARFIFRVTITFTLFVVVIWSIIAVIGEHSRGKVNYKNFYPFEIGDYRVYEVHFTDFSKSPPVTEKIRFPKKLVVTGTKEINGIKTFCEEFEVYGQPLERSYSSLTKYGISNVASIDASGDTVREDVQKNPIPYLKFPLICGFTWKWEGKIFNTPTKLNYANLGTEEITTPAGKFKAHLIEDRGTNDKNEIISRRWYADGIGYVKEELTNRTQKYKTTNILTEYSINGKVRPKR